MRHVHLLERRVALLTRAGLAAGALAVLGLAAYLFAAREARLEHEHALVLRPSDTNAQPRQPDTNGAPRLATSFLDEVRRFWDLSHTIGYTWPASNAPPHDHLAISPNSVWRLL